MRWRCDLLDLGALTPAEQLWVIAHALEELEAPRTYVPTLRELAATLEELGFWLAEVPPRDR